MDNNQTPKTLHQQLTDDKKSTLARYQDIALGSDSYWYLIKYEFIMLFASWVPGALGLLLRKISYPWILGSVGKRVVFGQGVVVRHGLKIHIGDNVIVDDGAVLDAKGEDNIGIHIANDTIISRNVVLSCKNGNITLGASCTIGMNTLIHAMQGSDVRLGDAVLVGAFCYFIGSGPYESADLNLPFKQQGIVPQGGICIANNVWFGSHVQVLDGVSVQTGAIIGASALVNKDVAENAIVAGVPIQQLKTRR